MEEHAYITSVIAGAFYLIASLRLLRLNRRTGEQPELLLGFYFGLSGVYYLGYNLPSLLGLDPWTATAEWVLEGIYVLGVLPYLFFIRRVFRPENAWAGMLVGYLALLLVLGTVLGALDGRVIYSFDNPWFLVQWAGYTAPCAWMCWEAMLSRQGAQKRARLGLAEPLVVNRYLLLALFGGFQSLACLADLSFANDVSAIQTASLISNLLLGSSEIASVAVLWLAFFPPRFYSDWITRRAVILPTPMDG
jgi:hypothetical protein